MKRLILVLISIFSFGQVLFAADGGDWLEVNPDARGSAMGSAQISVQDNAYANFWNPAGIKKVQSFDSTVSKLYGQLDYKYFSYSLPGEYGRMSFGYMQIGLSGFERASYVNGRPQLDNDQFEYSNSALMFSIANSIADDPLQVGCTIKYLNQKLDKETASGLTTDLGLQYTLDSGVHLGAVVYNFFSTGMDWSTGVKEDLGMRAKLGVSYAINESLLLSMDHGITGYSENALSYGCEYNFNKNLFLRAGYNNNALCCGAGVNINGLKVDYAYTTAPADYMENSSVLSLGYELPNLDTVITN